MSVVPRLHAAVIFILLAASPLDAATRFSLNKSRPAPDGGSFFTVLESRSLPRLDWNAGSVMTYEYLPMKALSGVTGVHVVEHFLVEHFFGSIGLNDWAMFSVDMPVIWYNRFANPDQPSSVSNKLGIGDQQLSARFRLADRNRAPVGIGVAPFMTLPSGKAAYFMGDEGVTAGGRLIVDGNISERLIWAVNLGGLTRRTFNAYNINFGDQFLLSGGINLKATDTLAAVGEIETVTPFGDFFGDKNTTSMDGRAGVQWKVKDSMTLDSAGTYGLFYGAGSPHYGAFLGFNFHHPSKPEKSGHARQEPVKVTIREVFQFASHGVNLTPDDKNRLDGIAKFLGQHPDIGRLIIDGYSDSEGTRRNNRKISRMRAQLIKKYLIRNGGYRGVIDVKGWGEVAPMASNKTANGRAMNRRVELRVP